MPAPPENPFGTAAHRVDADSPWLGLLPFTEETQRFFFGRDAEVREVFLRVRDHSLTVLYGQSGLGKTSLIGAGLIPKLRADGFRPVLLRLRFEENDPPPLEQVRAALAGISTGGPESAEMLLERWHNATLWECFHHSALRSHNPAPAQPVLIFDQFEEIFTLGAAQRPRRDIESLAVNLADLVENRLPASMQARVSDDLDLASELDFSPSPLRVIITLREDFLSHLEAWKAAMPALMRNRMALHLLRGSQALEAVVRPGRLDGRNLVSDEVGAQIVQVIARQPAGTPLEEIEAVPPLLSLLCDELNRARDGAPEITAELVEKRHGNILHEFYGRCFSGFPPSVRRFVEDRLVTVGGFRNQVARDDAEADLSRSGVSSPGEVLDTLLTRRLLSAEERGGTQRIEITHDVLAPLVTESRDIRHERERAERAEAERHIAEENARRIAREKRRLRRFAIVTGVAAALAIAGMIIGFVGMKRAEKANLRTQKANRQSTALLTEAAQSDRAIAEEKLRVGDGPAAFAHVARAMIYEPASTLSAEKAVAALNDWRFPAPLAILQGHAIDLEEHITDAQFSSDGQRIVTTSDDDTPRIWEVQTGKLLVVLPRGENAQFSRDGRRILFTFGNTASILEAKTGKLLGTFQEDAGDIGPAQFSPDDQRIVTAGGGNDTARVWDVQTGKLLVTLQGHSRFVGTAKFSPDGQRIVTTSLDHTARVWEAQTGKLLATIQSDTGPPNTAEFSSDSQRIVTTFSDNTARIWEAQTGELMVTIQGHTGVVNTAYFSPDGQRVVTSSDDDTARVWEAQTGKLLATLQGHTGAVNSAHFSPDNQRIVTASDDRTARIWDAQTTELLATLQGCASEVRDAGFSPDGRHIVTESADTNARIWEVQTNELLATIQGHEGVVNSGQFSPNGKRIVTSSDDNTARVWEAQTGKLLTTLQGHTGWVNSARFSPDGKRIVTESLDNTARIWEVQTGRVLATLHSDTEKITGAQFSPDSQHIVTTSDEDTAGVWEAQTGKLLFTLQGHTDTVYTAQFSPDNRRIVTASRDHTACVWDAKSGKLLATLRGHTGEVYSAQFSPDGKRIVTSSPDDTARLWDAQTGKLLFTLQGHTDTVYTAQFSPDGQFIVTASGDRTARIWETQNGKLHATLRGHIGGLSSAQFSPDGQRVVTTSPDKTARIWEAQTGRLVATLHSQTGELHSVQFSPDGQHIITASRDYSAHIWTILPPSAGMPPRWFRDFLQYMGQSRLDQESALEPISDSDFIALRNQLRQVTRDPVAPDTPYLRILRHFVHD